MHYWRKMNKIEAERGIRWFWELMMTMMKHKLRKKCLVTLSFDIKLIPISIIIIIIHKYFVPSPSPILHHSYIIIWSTWCSSNAHTYGKDERCTFWWDRMWREPYWIFFWEFLLFYIFLSFFHRRRYTKFISFFTWLPRDQRGSRSAACRFCYGNSSRYFEVKY